MFGYVAANAKTLSPDELEIYKGLYCGLCRVLKRSYVESLDIGLLSHSD